MVADLCHRMGVDLEGVMWGRIGLLMLAGAMTVGVSVIGAPALADDTTPTSVEETATPAEPPAAPAAEPQPEPTIVAAAEVEARVRATVADDSADVPPPTADPAGMAVAAAIAGLSFTPPDALPGGASPVSGDGCAPRENVLIRTFSTTLGVDAQIDVIQPAAADGSFSIATRVWGAPGDPVGAAGGEQIGVAAYCGGAETTDPDRRQIVFGTMATPVEGPLPPIATPDTASTAYETAVTIDVLDNDTGDDLRIVAGTNGDHGDVVWASDGSSITYTPDAGFSGTDTFGYSIRNAANLQAISTVTVTVAPPPPPGPPVAIADTYSTPYETPLDVAAPGVLTNDTDPNDDSITALLGTGPAHGGLAFFPDGSFTYTPNPGFTGTDTFEYSGSDGTSSGARTTVTITIGPPAVTGPDEGSSHGKAAESDDAHLPDTGAGPAWPALIALILLGAGSVALRFSRS